MKQLFYKVQASGNDFILIDKTTKSETTAWYKKFSRKFSAAKTGIGADGVLVAESQGKKFVMRIFNADGSEAEMCGNGARAFALWTTLFKKRFLNKGYMEFTTKAGVIAAKVEKGIPSIRLSEPFDFRGSVKFKVNGRDIAASFVNTGVPHTVVFVEKTDIIDVDTLGSAIRYHEKFKPAGTNVNFLEVLGKRKIKIRTYERGVGETLACGTGAAASAIIFALRTNILQPKNNVISVLTKSNTVLTVSFEYANNKPSSVWLRGAADITYTGTLEL